MSAIDVDGDAAHEAAQRELAKPIYPKGSISQRIQEWIHELLYRLIEQGSSVPGGWLTIAVLIILAVAALMVAVRIVRRTIRTHGDGDLQLFDNGQRTALEHRAIAERCAAEGDWAGAIRHRLRAAARSLEETGVIEPAPGRTANELAADVGERLPALASRLSRSAIVFNDVSYGGQPGTQSGYRLIVDLDEHIHYRSFTNQFEPTEPQIDNLWTPAR